MFKLGPALVRALLLSAALAVLGAPAAVGQSSSGYYAGKTVKIAAGGGYDL